MTQRESAKVQTALFRDKSWVFLTHDVMPEIAEVGIVQRFASRTTDHLHYVVLEEGAMDCTCPRWRKHGKCWHVRWVLEYNISDDWSVGTYVDRLPLAREQEHMDDEDDWTAWLENHIAEEDRPRRGLGDGVPRHNQGLPGPRGLEAVQDQPDDAA